MANTYGRTTLGSRVSWATPGSLDPNAKLSGTIVDTSHVAEGFYIVRVDVGWAQIGIPIAQLVECSDPEPKPPLGGWGQSPRCEKLKYSRRMVANLNGIEPLSREGIFARPALGQGANGLIPISELGYKCVQVCRCGHVAECLWDWREVIDVLSSGQGDASAKCDCGRGLTFSCDPTLDGLLSAVANGLVLESLRMDLIRAMAKKSKPFAIAKQHLGDDEGEDE